MSGIEHVEVRRRHELAVAGLAEKLLSLGDPVSFACWILRVFHRAELGQHEVLVRVCKSETPEVLYKLSEIAPRSRNTCAAVVPVVCVGCNDVHIGVTGIPLLGSPTVGSRNHEGVVGHDPRSAECVDLLVGKDGHECLERSDELVGVAVVEIGCCLWLVVEGEPNLILEGLDRPGPSDHVVVKLASGLCVCDSRPLDW